MSEELGVPIEDLLARRAGLSAPARMYQENIAGPLTVATKKFVNGMLTYHPVLGPATAGVASLAGIDPSAIREPIAEEAGKVIPQTLTGAALTAATLPLGVATRGITGLAGAATRIGGMTGLGAGLGYATGEGGPMGAAQGAVQGVLGEVLNKGLDYARTVGLDRMRAKAQLYDARNFGDMLTEQFPLFGRRQTPQDLYQLVMPQTGVKGGVPLGQQMLKDAQETAHQGVLQALQAADPKFTPTFPLFPGPRTMPGTPAVMSPLVTSTGAPITTTPAAAPARELLSYDDARHHLTELYNRGYHGIKGDPRLAGLSSSEAKQAYAEGVKEFDAVLEGIQPGISAITKQARTQYRQGMAYLDLLEKAFKSFGADKINFNSDALMQMLSDPRQARRLASRLQDPGARQALSNAVTRGQGPGLVDEFNANSFLERIAERFHPTGGFTISGRLSRPNLVGQPFKAGGIERHAVELGSAIAANQGRDVMAQYGGPPIQMLQNPQ